jgi:hypothetical protein
VTDARRNPFSNPLVRHGVGAVGALAIAVVAFTFLEGTVRLVALGVAVLDLLVTPQVLKRAAAG